MAAERSIVGLPAGQRNALADHPVDPADRRIENTSTTHKSIEGRGIMRSSAHGPPLADRAIAGDQHATALVTTRDELKEEMRCIGLERQIAELVDDQQFWFAKVSEAILEPTLAMGLGELRHQ